MENVEIARALQRVADLLEIQGANPFRVRAYANGARIVEGYPRPMRALVEEDADLTEIKGIGKDLARYIRELVESGRMSFLAKLEAEVPPGVLELTRVSGVGAKKARKVWQELGVTSLAELEAAAREGKLAALEGFGEKSQEKILAALAEVQQREQRVRLAEADQLVRPLLEHLRAAPGVDTVEAAGSWRRRRETVGDIDVLALADEAGPVMEHFTSWKSVRRVEGAGETRATVVLTSGLQVDLRVVPRESFGAALVYFTGSKAHNIKLRQRALERGLSISEYGVMRKDGKGEHVAGSREEDVYAAVDLPWITPELREDRGEIEAAESGALPDLIGLEDLRGDLQMHSTWSDGRHSIEEMVEACAALGYEYMAITDHSKALAMTGGLDAAALRRQWEEIAEVAERHPEIAVLRGQEVDILADGSLDQDDDALEELDLVVASVHSRFDLSEARQTERILKALEHPRVHLLAHPTGRLIGSRSPYAVDLEAVLGRCAELGVAVECNAQPERLDLDDVRLARARELGVKVMINTDAHSSANLQVMRYGVDQARRAWIEPRHVLNTLPLSKLKKALRR